MAALGFLSGFQGGMQSTLGLLDALDVRKRREQQAMQQQITFNNQQEAYNYDKSVLRPLRENEANLRLQDLRGSVDYNKQYRPLQLNEANLRLQDLESSVNYNKKYRPLQLDEANLRLQDLRGSVEYNKEYRPLQLDDAKFRLENLKTDRKWAEEDRQYTVDVLRPQEKKVSDLNYNVSSYNFETTKQNNEQQREQQNLVRANQLYTAASSLVETNPAEAERLMGEADRLTGGLFTNAAQGVNTQMMGVAQKVARGELDINDRSAVDIVRRYTQPTLNNTGRAGKYETDSIEPLPDGRIAYNLMPVGMDQIAKRMIEVESGGRSNAKNPNSSAEGRGQFIDSTWLSMMRKHQPDLIKGKTESEILALKRDPRIADAMTTAYAKDNSVLLAEAGVPINAATIYSAHHFGPQGAINLAQANQNQPAIEVLGAKVIAANPHLKGKSIGEVNAWIRRKMTVPATKNRSSDPSDVIVADTPDEAMAKIQQGVALEQQMNPKLKEMLLARQLATGSKPAESVTGKDRYMPVDGRVFDVVSQQFVTDKSTEGEKLIKVGKDERLYDPATGAWVSSSGAGAGNGSLVDLLGEDSALAPVAAIVDKQNPELSLPKKLEKAKTLAGTDFDLESDPASKALDANFKANRLQGAEAWLGAELSDYVQSGDISTNDIKVFAQKIAKQDLENDAAEHLVVSELRSRLIAKRDKLQLQKQYSDEGRAIASAEGYEEPANIAAGYQKRDQELARLNQRIAELDAVLNPKQQ